MSTKKHSRTSEPTFKNSNTNEPSLSLTISNIDNPTSDTDIYINEPRLTPLTDREILEETREIALSIQQTLLTNRGRKSAGGWKFLAVTQLPFTVYTLSENYSEIVSYINSWIN